jgi:hypothetical protein
MEHLVGIGEKWKGVTQEMKFVEKNYMPNNSSQIKGWYLFGWLDFE